MGLLPAVDKFSDEESEQDQSSSLLFQFCHFPLFVAQLSLKSPKLHSGHFLPPKPQEPRGSQGMKRPAPGDDVDTVAKRPAAKQPKKAAKPKAKGQAKKKAKAKAKAKVNAKKADEETEKGGDTMDAEQKDDSEQPDGQAEVEPDKVAEVDKPTAKPKKKPTKKQPGVLKRPAAANTGPAKLCKQCAS